MNFSSHVKKIDDNKVKIKTEKKWNDWFLVLDDIGATEMNHKDIANYLNQNQGVSPWWTQTITVTYERERGLRKMYQRSDGSYYITVSKIINKPLTLVYSYWIDEKLRNRWLSEKNTTMSIQNSTQNKYLKIIWYDKDKSTVVSVNFFDKGKDKTQVMIEHTKLDKNRIEEMKLYWKTCLSKLNQI